MRIAIFGGSFNPLHIGHAMLADTIVNELKYDKILFVPTCVPPHKEISAKVSVVQRVEMVQAFCDSVPGNVFELETCEIDRGGISYTVDTIAYILKKYEGQIDGKPGLLMGEEIAAEFHKWKNPEIVAKYADLIIVPRYPDYYGFKSDKFKNIPTGNYCGDFKAKFDRKSFGYPCKYLEIPILTVSSTEIRARRASGKSFKYLVPAPVFDYIEKHNLYR